MPNVRPAFAPATRIRSRLPLSTRAAGLIAAIARNAGAMQSPSCLRCKELYGAWLEALPDTLQGTVTADALQAIAELDLDSLAAIDPPSGYGRD
jgi:hypothetical protein